MTKNEPSSRRFLPQFLAHPGKVGAVSPSSQRLARRMVEWIDWGEVSAVVEYGPGTGIFTERILSEIEPGTRFFGIELNPNFFAAVQRRFPGVQFYNDSVENVETLCGRHGIEGVDAIVSGLPWASFSEDAQTKYMEATMRVLRPGGQFVTFAYLQGLALPAGRRFKTKLHELFSSVEYSATVWLNLPPAFVYRCRR